MDEFASKIEALEHLWMRSWAQRDRNQMKKLAARDFIFLLGSTKPAILDRASWLEAATPASAVTATASTMSMSAAMAISPSSLPA